MSLLRYAAYFLAGLFIANGVPRLGFGRAQSN
jgi:hypothetical protein